MVSNRARRIAYLEKLVSIREKEERRLLELLDGRESLIEKVRTQAHLTQIEAELAAERSEIEALKRHEN